MASGRMSSGSRGGSSWTCDINSPVRAAPEASFCKWAWRVWTLSPLGSIVGSWGRMQHGPPVRMVAKQRRGEREVSQGDCG